MMYPTILIVDDEPSILQALSGLLADEGFKVLAGQNGYEALKLIEAESPDLVLLDIWMTGIDGIETLMEIRKDNPHLPVVIITGHGNIETAVRATKLGAFDLIEKPLSIERVIVAINNALNFRKLEEENRYLRKKMLENSTIDGNSPATRMLREAIEKAALSDTRILIYGEHGTGKRMVARMIHLLGPRADAPLIELNCAVVPEHLIESDLFGCEKGALPGADSKSIGKFELASNGTLFLCEINDMSLKMQAKFLHALKTRQIQRVGGQRMIDVNARVIGASHKDLEKEVKRGKFRKDLYYRLSAYPIVVPPLRERAGDIPVLAKRFLTEFAKTSRTRKKKISSAALEILRRCAWPGNVRELKNLVERLAILVQRDVIGPEDIPAAYRADSARQGLGDGHEAMAVANFKDAKRAFEETYLTKRLMENDYNITRTAKAIGVDRGYLSRRLKALEIQVNGGR